MDQSILSQQKFHTLGTSFPLYSMCHPDVVVIKKNENDNFWNWATEWL